MSMPAISYTCNPVIIRTIAFLVLFAAACLIIRIMEHFTDKIIPIQNSRRIFLRFIVLTLSISIIMIPDASKTLLSITIIFCSTPSDWKSGGIVILLLGALAAVAAGLLHLDSIDTRK